MVIFDTAGAFRSMTSVEELEVLNKNKPHEILLVADAALGQKQLMLPTFHESGSGIVLTKVDDARVVSLS